MEPSSLEERKEGNAGGPVPPASAAPLTLALAPMDGISDSDVRALLSELGGMDLCVTEFLRVCDRPLHARALYARCPELTAGGRTPSGTPVLLQLLGSDPTALAETATLAYELGASGIDLNFGCPAKRVNGHDGGAALLKSPKRLERIVSTVRRAVALECPVSAKIRLGWSNPDDVLDLTRAAEAGGASFITIHGRTRDQMYRERADWRRIGMAAAAVRVPIVANGDVFDPHDLRRCLRVTGCCRVMLGRGAFRRPNLFRWLRGWDRQPWPSERCAVLLRRFAARVAARSDLRNPERAALARLKQWVNALAHNDPAMAACFTVLKRSSSLDEALDCLLRHFPISKTTSKVQG